MLEDSFRTRREWTRLTTRGLVVGIPAHDPSSPAFLPSAGLIGARMPTKTRPGHESPGRTRQMCMRQPRYIPNSFAAIVSSFTKSILPLVLTTWTLLTGLSSDIACCTRKP